MASKLIDICGYAKGKIAVAGLTDQTYISTENMLPNKGGITKATSLPSAESTQAYKKNDVLVSNIRPYFKKIWHAECDGGCSNDVLVFRAAEGVDPTYLYYVLADDNFFNYATATSKGTKMPRGDKSAIMEYCVPDFGIGVQRKIGSLLRSIDQRIVVNSKINDNLQQQMEALFSAWFVEFIPFGGVIPADWRYIKFSDFLTPRAEKSNNPTIPLYSVTDTGIYPRDEKFKKNLSMTSAKNKVIYDTDLVFGMSREILNWGIMRSTIGGVSSAYNVFAVNSTINSFYLESFIKHNSPYFKDLIKPASREGQGIDKGILSQKELLLPPSNVLESYYAIETPLRHRVESNNEENIRLSQLRDTLLPKLMSGEIDVSDIQL